MIYPSYLCDFLLFSKDFPPMNTKDTLIQIGSDKFYLLGEASFQSFEFKKNKRGGEKGKLKFVKMFGNYKVNDKVIFRLEGVNTFTGIIESVSNYGLNLEIIPLWGKLDRVFITGDSEPDIEDTVYNILLTLETKIRSAGIYFNIENIEILQGDYTKIKTSLSGRSIRDILDELEGVLPSSYIWGVDGYSNFYFKSFKETATGSRTLSWHSGDFSSSEFEEDYSELFSQYIVKMKNYETDSFNVLKPVVGDDPAYLSVAFLREAVGQKTKIFEYNFETSEAEALGYAHKMLKAQLPNQKIKLKTINFKKNILNQNEAYTIILKPIENFFEDFKINFSTVPTISSVGKKGEIMRIGFQIGYARKRNINYGLFYLTDQPNYLDACNRALDIRKIEVKYLTEKSQTLFIISDGTKEIKKYGESGFLSVNVKGFDKRKLSVRTAKNIIINYVGMRGYFSQGSRKLEANLRNITYKYSKGIINVDLEMAKLNASLTGYIWSQKKKLDNLEAVMTSKNGKA